VTRNDFWYFLLALTLGAILLSVPYAHGAACAVPNNHAIVYPSTTQVYQQQQAQQTYQQTYQAVAVAVPLYSASAPGLSPEVILLLQQITESMKQTNALLEAHESRLAVVERGNYVLPAPPGVQAAPRRQRAPAPESEPPEMPPAALGPVSTGTPKLFVASCVKCHDSKAAAAKGGGFALISVGHELPLTCYQMLEMQDRLTLDPSDPKFMPKGGKQQDADDVADVIDHLKQLAKARK
jgi:hypothetical protein